MGRKPRSPWTPLPGRGCSDQPDLDGLVPGLGHYFAHWRRGQEGCPQALAEQAAHKWKRNHGGLEGFAYRPHIEEYLCEPHPDWIPNSAHRSRHLSAGETPCGWSLLELQAHRYQQRGDPFAERIFNCAWDDGGTDEGHYQWHRKPDKPPTCDVARAQYMRYHRIYRTGTTELGDRLDRPHRVYQITFLDGDRYYGITARTLNHRLTGHLSLEGYEVGDRLQAGEPYTMEQLCETPDGREAQVLERMMVRSGNPWGRVINRVHNPEYGYA